MMLTIAGDRFKLKIPEGTGEGKVVLDLAKQPHRLDLVGKAVTLYCTYELEKGKLRLCWWTSAKDRQGNLDPLNQKPPGVLLEMERAKKDPGPALDARR
jgi:hypothetical protein